MGSAQAYAALEALEAGDHGELVEVLLAALDDGRSARGCECPRCGLDCRWPGRLEDHVRVVHGLTYEEAGR